MRAVLFMKPTSQNLPNSSDKLQSVDLKPIFLYFPEELSPGASLMARDLSLGPSDAPCPVETSTVHGDPFFSTANLTTKKDKFSRFSALTMDLAHSLLVPDSLTPEKTTSTTIDSPPPGRRRAHIPRGSSKEKLGFLQVGLVSKSGPLSFMRPKPISCNPSNKTRSAPIHKPSVLRFVTFNIQSNPNLYVSCFILVGRRLHPSRVVSYLVWLACYQCRGLMVKLAQLPSEDISLLKNFDRLKFLIWLLSSRTLPECSRKASNLYASNSIRRLSDFKSVQHQSSSFMERKSFTPASFMGKTFPSPYLNRLQARKLRYRSILLTVLLLCVVCFVSVKPTVMEPSATSRSQLAVTNSSLHEMLVDVFPTSLWFACGNLVYTFCLRYHLLSSVYPISLNVVVFIAFNFDVLNFEFAKLFSYVTT